MTIDRAKNKQFVLTLSTEMLEHVETVQHSERIPNRNEAIRRLLAEALAARSAREKE